MRGALVHPVTGALPLATMRELLKAFTCSSCWLLPMSHVDTLMAKPQPGRTSQAKSPRSQASQGYSIDPSYQLNIFKDSVHPKVQTQLQSPLALQDQCLCLFRDPLQSWVFFIQHFSSFNVVSLHAMCDVGSSEHAHTKVSDGH